MAIKEQQKELDKLLELHANNGETCPNCGNFVGTFKDVLSHKEYFISGMCQKCQDYIFGTVRENDLGGLDNA